MLHPARKPIIMVSSTVYGIEPLLNVVYGILEGFGYTVWMSHKGTLPLDPRKTNLDNCVDAVRGCDLFFGIINGRYGSVVSDDRSTTHHEILEAVQLDKMRWFAVHQNLDVARQLLKQYRFLKDGTPNPAFTYARTPIMDDIRVLEMYEDALRLTPRAAAPGVATALQTGRWVQPYSDDEDLKRYIASQFSDIDHIRRLLSGMAGGGTT